MTFAPCVLQAAVALDRTRAILNEGEKSMSMNVTNQNKELPYLVQGWLEDAQGNKINSPLVVLPPLQRLEAGAKTQIKVQGLPAVTQLPKDRESLFYFNLREIPPRSDKPNTLQIALQTRIKLFFRPEAIAMTQHDVDNPWQEKITLQRQGDRYQVHNPTPYFVTIVEGASSKGANIPGFEAVMVEPQSSAMLNVAASKLGNAPVLTYINDWGGRPELKFSCQGNTCQVEPGKRS
ncbi:fimbria/pilus periplasmic chaperone [Serratia fonticola]|uniref:fimbria/pilus periplasmic chaperone n=1 Tax=Serratia fonticola TaxID=47917 RepID=UPI003AAF2428